MQSSRTHCIPLLSYCCLRVLSAVEKLRTMPKSAFKRSLLWTKIVQYPIAYWLLLCSHLTNLHRNKNNAKSNSNEILSCCFTTAVQCCILTIVILLSQCKHPIIHCKKRDGKFNLAKVIWVAAEWHHATPTLSSYFSYIYSWDSRHVGNV